MTGADAIRYYGREVFGAHTRLALGAQKKLRRHKSLRTKGGPMSGVSFERTLTRAVAASFEVAVFDTPLRGSSDSRKPRTHCPRLPAPPLGHRERAVLNAWARMSQRLSRGASSKGT
jgi:hypothetical protein